MRFTSEQRLDDGVVEREFTLGRIPGILWTPAPAFTRAPAPRSAPEPLILLGHPGGLRTMYPRLVARARQSAADGFATTTIELPGSGERRRSAAAEEARAALRRALEAGEPVSEEIVDRLVLPLVGKAVPEWQAALDALLSLPGIGGPVGYSGGVISLGVRLAVVEPRISAAVLFAGSFVPRVMFAEARQVTIPLHVLLQWDDEGTSAAPRARIRAPSSGCHRSGCAGGGAVNLQNDRGAGHGAVLVHGDPLAGLDVRPVRGREGHETDCGPPAGLQRGHVLDPERGDADRAFTGG
ncbi:hypothetical protein [Streptomyces lavendofoliae]|uniref:hypothetical protein n=1 Tax=Streptomyces lavendofoliae TaxID=67314 RepID=UPI001E59701D|nr:hypothetical protein [Streptomyces lavendofoliae]